MSWSESGKKWLESTNKLNPFGRNWFESTKNMNLSERAKNWFGTANDGFGKSKSWVEGKVSADTLDLLIKAGEILLPGYYGAAASACGLVLKCAPSAGDCLKMFENRSDKTKSWTEMAKNWYGTIRATGISDEPMDLVVKGGGTLLLAAACGLIFRVGDGPGDLEKLMKAPGRPGEFIARATFEASPKAYFRGLRGKLP